ncbi:spore germination protein [Geomicrobium halophilum]|uniref:Spore germination protein n=1 Tax=Geomicrobium halophilum TaxID=549000 RepID=A0A841PZH1_9BACL|nr:Ger(x)C family spore germination protein [Geomicrobium halophilum]MBB6448068.1 spore germination protein [Geomicrobium halophilum]
MNRAIRIAGLLLLLIGAGCSPQVRQIEDIQYIQAMGHDDENGDIQTTGVTTIFMPGQEVLPESETLTVSNVNLEGLYAGLQSESSRYVDTSRVRVELYSEELAAEGIFQQLDTIQRNPMIEQDRKIAINRGSAKEILEEDYPFHLTVNEYLDELIDQNIEAQIPQANFHDFLYRYYAGGADPFLPLLEKQEGRVEVIGLALFQGDMYTEDMDLEDTQVFRKLAEKTEEGTINIDLNENKGVTFHHLSSQPNWSIQQESEAIHIQANVDVEGVLQETRGIDVSQPENIQQLEQIASAEFKNRMEEIIQFLQENEIDPIGIGERVDQNVRGIDIKQWEEEEYPNVDVGVNVEFTIENTGAVES